MDVERNDFTAPQMHGVKLVWGNSGQVAHVPVRAFKSNYTSSPKRRTIGELLEQIVFMVHRSPLFTATL